jgi:peptide subunit release factor 1 (eRF1)
MKAGGQSAQRFSRIRDNEITKWYKRINSCINNIEGSIYVSINFVYKNRFNKYLHTYNKTKIKQYDKNEYSGLTGIYQYINYLENNQ